MNKTFYVLSDGALSADQNVFRFDSKEKMSRIPVETVLSLNLYGGVSVTSGAFKLAGQYNIPIHIFGYYGNYIGTYWPKESHFSGDLTIKQALSYSDMNKRLVLSSNLMKGVILNMRQTLKKFERDLGDIDINLDYSSIERLMLSEARLRKDYYSRLDAVLPEPFMIITREKRPPTNYGNCLISFVNSLIYSELVTQSRHTSVNITIPFYHSPNSGRFALALDLSEIFKPGLGDRFIASITRQGIIKPDSTHFHTIGGGILLNERGRKVLIENWESWLELSNYNEKLKRKVSHRELIRMEIHKFAKDIEGIEPYKPIRFPAD